MEYTPLPYKEEFLLELTNNNYSQETIYNYERDLGFFESFLWTESLRFEDVDKLAISKYKGFLQKGDHVTAAQDLEDFKKEQAEKKSLEEMGLDDHEETQEKSQLGADLDRQEAEGSGTQGDAGESRSNASKIDFKKKEGLSPRSINRFLTSLRVYLKFLVEIDHKVPISADAIKLIRTERKESQVADLDDLIALIEAPDNFETNRKVKFRNRAILELIFSTGMRISEVVSIDREQLTLFNTEDDDSISDTPDEPMNPAMSDYIAGKLYIKGKGKKSRFVYLTKRCRYYLERYLSTRHDEYPALFIPYRGGRAGTNDPQTVRISVNYIQDKIVKYRRKLSISVPTSAHSLRHGFATYLAEEGASPAAIQHLLGHESLQTTTRYVHASDHFAEKTHRKFHPLQALQE